MTRGYALAAALTFTLWSGVAWGASGHVENRCPRLTQAEYDELDARVLLLMKGGEGKERGLPAIVCEDKAKARIEWGGQGYDIVGRASLVDEAVDIVEGVLHGDARRAEADPRTTEDGAVAAGQPMLERGAGASPAPPPKAQRADPLAVIPRDARGGGIAVSFETENVGGDVGIAIGPAFDFAASVGPILLGGREAIRFTVSDSDRELSFMDFEGAIAYGAPFNPDRRLGVVLRFGAEWMVAYPEGNSGQATLSPVADLGVRVTIVNIGPVGLWAGLDMHTRLRQLRLRSSGDIEANQVSGSLTIGAAFVDWSRK